MIDFFQTILISDAYDDIYNNEGFFLIGVS